ncbi:MAG: T9SS type A sorting domain-containing protein [Bacteroidetes bacterium]|nr:T9SS type A sorting domain-containing protein [Bacteroidota bacterium]
MQNNEIYPTNLAAKPMQQSWLERHSQQLPKHKQRTRSLFARWAEGLFQSSTQLPAVLGMAFLLSLFASAQVQAQKATISCKPVALDNKNLAENFSAYEVYEVPVDKILEVKTKQQQFDFVLKLGDKHIWNLNLYESGIMGPNYQEVIGTENGRVVLPKRDNISFFGYSNPGGREVALTIDKDWIMGFVEIQNGQRYYIEPLTYTVPGAEKNRYLVYRAEDIINPQNVNCGYIETEQRAPSLNEYSHDMMHDGDGGEKMLACHVVDFSVASTFDMINAAHNSAALVMNHVVSITTMMEVFYSYHAITFQINENYVASSVPNDPLLPVVATANVDTLLPNFMAWAQGGGFGNHDLGQMWTARNIYGCGGTNNFGLVGCAYIAGTCGNFRYNVCEDFAPANLGYTSILSAHEIGHNFSALHSDSDPAPNNIMDGTLDPNATGFGTMSRAKIDAHTDGASGSCLSACPSGIANDNCADAITAVCGNFFSGTTVNANIDGPGTSCTGGSVGPDVWYTIVGTGGLIRASLCFGTNYDSKLDIYTGSCGSFTSVACDDDFCSFVGPSQVTWASTLGTTYYVRVHGFSGSSGDYGISFSCSAILTCPTNTTTAACQTQAQVNAAFTAWLATASVNESCGETISNNNTGAPSNCGGSTTVTFTYASDCSPVETSCSATFTVAAPPPVVLTCPVNMTVASCQTQTTVDGQFDAWLASASASGGCNGVLTNNNTGAPSICGGATTVTFTYTSTCAPFTTTCNATFTVNAPPTVVLTCPVNTTVASCQTQTAVDGQFDAWLASASASGGCNGVLTNNNTGAPSSCGGSTTVTFTYTSTCAPFTTTCNATFTVNAPPPVVLTCPVNTTVSPCLTQAQVNSAYASWLASASGSGGCNGVLTNNNPGPPTICNPNAVTQTVTFTYTSTCAPFTTTCTATFTLPAYPDFTVPANGAATVPCPANATTPTPPVVLDACGKTTTRTGPVITNNPNPLVCEGTRTYTYTYTDCAGHSHQWSFVYTVIRLDFGVPPNGGSTVDCPDDTDAQPTPPVVFSNCGELLTPVLTNVTPKPGCEGNRNYVWTYTDCAGHSHDWTYIYTVEYEDFVVPPSEVNDVECPLNAIQPTPPVVYDNCGKLLTPSGPVISTTNNAYGCEGSRKYEWTYKDCEGNTNLWSKTFNFLYTADFFVYPDGEDFVACVSYAQPPIPPAIYDICGQPIKVTGPTTTESLSALGCTGWRKFVYVYSDCGGHSHPWTYTYYINDNQAPLGTCPSSNSSSGPIAVSVTDLSCISEVPCPDDYDFSTKVEEMLEAGNYFDVCSGNDLVVTMDSYTDLWDCSDPDGDGVYTFGRTFYFSIADPCGNVYPDLCAVTFSGECLPIQTFAQKDWGNEGDMPGAPLGLTDLAVIQSLLTDPIKIGGTNRSMSLDDAQCIMDMLPATGGPNRLRNCHQVNCTGCNPMVNGGLQNSLAGGLISLHLNLRYSEVYEGVSMSDLLDQSLDCIDVHPCISSCEGGNCELRIFDGAGNPLVYPYTIGGLISLTNLYLDGNLGLSPGFMTLYGTALNQAVNATNDYWSGNSSLAANACADGLQSGGDGGEKRIVPIGKFTNKDGMSYLLAPNPASDEVTFTFRQQEAPEAVSIEIYNGIGQQMLRKEYGAVANISERISLGHFGTGIYFVRIKAGDAYYQQKLIISKD